MDEAYLIHYEFIWSKQRRIAFPIRLDPATIAFLPRGEGKAPEWARLGCHQCENCPLDSRRHPHCPVALNIADIVEAFQGTVSYDRCLVRCTTPERTYLKKTSITEALFSIFGIVMATSGCPVMDFFRPMARFHLPFATTDETAFRVTAMFLLRGYLAAECGVRFPSDLTGLEDRYAEVKKVNQGLFQRIGSVATSDADKNAIVMFHALSEMFSSGIRYSLADIAHLFFTEG